MTNLAPWDENTTDSTPAERMKSGMSVTSSRKNVVYPFSINLWMSRYRSRTLLSDPSAMYAVRLSSSPLMSMIAW